MHLLSLLLTRFCNTFNRYSLWGFKSFCWNRDLEAHFIYLSQIYELLLTIILVFEWLNFISLIDLRVFKRSWLSSKFQSFCFCFVVILKLTFILLKVTNKQVLVLSQSISTLGVWVNHNYLRWKRWKELRMLLLNSKLARRFYKKIILANFLF